MSGKLSDKEKEERKRKREKMWIFAEPCVKGTLLIRAQRLPFDRREIITGYRTGPLESVGKGVSEGRRRGGTQRGVEEERVPHGYWWPEVGLP